MEMKTYSICDSPQDICVAPERLNTSTSNTSCIYSQVKTITIMPSATCTAYSVSKLCFCSELGHDMQELLNMNLSTANQTLPPALGALLGIAVIALVVTTMGWVWTCWRMKKRGGIKINSDEQER